MKWKYSLDFLRAMAILLVLFYHLPLPQDYFWATTYAHIQKGFNSGVEMFFVLSGFLISGHWFEQIKAKQQIKPMMKDFYIKRTFRILPLYYLVLAFEAIRGTYLTKTPYNLFSYLTLTQNIFGKTIFPVSWSLCVEEHFYLFFPLSSFLFFSLNKGKWFLLFCFSLLLCSLSMRWNFYDHILTNPDTGLIQNTLFTLDGLLIGVFIAYAFTFHDEWTNCAGKYVRGIEALGFTIICFALWLAGSDYTFVKVVFLPTIFTLAYGSFIISAQYEKSIFNFAQSSFITLTSKISYPLYLTHYIAWMMVEILFRRLLITLPGFLILIINLIAAYVLAYLLHQVIEKKCLSLRKKFLSTP